MHVLVVGATGLVGAEICGRLAASGQQVRGLVRSTSDPAIRHTLAQEGVELVEGDLKDPASLARACTGMDVVISTANSARSRAAGDSIETVDLNGQKNLVDAARTAGVRRFVYISFSTGKSALSYAFKDAKLAVEKHLQASGMDYVILRPAIFMEVWLSPPLGIDAAAGTATLYGSGENPVSYVSAFDVANVAGLAATTPGIENRVFMLGGPEAVKPNDVVRAFERRTGRPIAVQHVPEEALKAQYESATDPLTRSFAAMMLMYAGGDPVDMRETLAAFPVTLKSVADHVERAAARP
ncbi:MAG TPA: SDR family oxidoreductase [Candidatus Eremiobacteraceae bacterium]|nr:SDR family oxidoreductase [Candidatus Eremiobacteraceae bacterium]